MTAALVVGDYQSGITETYAFARDRVPVVAGLVSRAREAGVLVVFVRVALRANGADVAPTNAMISALLHGEPDYRDGMPSTELDPKLGATDRDVVVVKHRTSAFAGTDLDLVLRARGVTSIVVAGVATSAMVAATVYDAWDRDYHVTVVRDGCADGDTRMHDFFVDTVFPARGVDVVSAEDWAPADAVPAR